MPQAQSIKAATLATTYEPYQDTIIMFRLQLPEILEGKLHHWTLKIMAANSSETSVTIYWSITLTSSNLE